VSINTKFEIGSINFEIISNGIDYEKLDVLKELFIQDLIVFDTNIENVIKNEMPTYFNSDNSQFLVISSDNQYIGYCEYKIDSQYITITQIYISEIFREIGLATYILEQLSNENKNSLTIRGFALPGDRVSKNFFESNLMKARFLIMESKNENRD
tara:strand:+ start:773 stop:1237 length:465 start_codon:yes stop_codon:yes gene_type:complete